MKTFKITYTTGKIKLIEEIDSTTLFINLMYDVYKRKSTLEAEPLANMILCSDYFGNYIYVIANTLEEAYNLAKMEISNHE